jgi:hypothetical protein
MTPARKNSGNALFIILICLGLFAALSYAITRSSSGTQSVSKETTQLAVDEVIQYAATLRSTVQRLVAFKGCTVGDGTAPSYTGTLNFASASFATPANYTNAGAPSDKSCDVFDPAGGGAAWQKPPTIAQAVGGSEYLITGGLSIKGVGSDSSGTSYFEMTLVTWVTKDMCMAINTLSGVTNTGGNPPTNTAGMTIPSTAAQGMAKGFSSVLTLNTAGGTPEVETHMTGCWYDTTGGHYNFYSVIAPR